MRLSALLLLASVLGATARDTTVVFTDGYMEGVIRLEIKDRVIAPTPDLLQGIHFDLAGTFGLYLRNTGLPDYNASCNGKDYSALLANPGKSARPFTMGFGSQGDTSWSQAGSVPSIASPLDSVKDRYPDMTERGAMIGSGWVYSVHVRSGCSTVEHQPMPGYRRILYYWRGSIGLKVQVDRFETEPVDCGNGLSCNQARYVHLRYGISDSLSFPTGIRSLSARPVGFRPAFPRPFWTYVLGRNAPRQEVLRATRNP